MIVEGYFEGQDHYMDKCGRHSDRSHRIFCRT